LVDGGEVSNEDILAAKMAGRADDKGITYVAFTATPKAKTMELFGRKGDDGLPVPFHVYSMRQAIEDPRQGTAGRHHGRPGRPQQPEQTGAGVGENPGGVEGCPAGTGAAL